MEAKPVSLETGHYFFDTKRLVEVDQFDYIYDVKSIYLDERPFEMRDYATWRVFQKGCFIELQDGSLWKVCPLNAESLSFYRNEENLVEGDSAENIVASWQPGERLIFHKVTNRIDLLVYNIDRNQVLNVTPFATAKDNAITITSFFGRVVCLSDGSAWAFDYPWSCSGWEVGNPVLVAKDNPWYSQHTHMLINLNYCGCKSEFKHINPNRVGVQRIQ